MTSPHGVLDILNLNISRYRELIAAETNPERKVVLQEALARDLKTKRERESPPPKD